MTPIMLALSGASAYPRACQALSSMLSRNALNPADITVVRHIYITLLPSLKLRYKLKQFMLAVVVRIKIHFKDKTEFKPNFTKYSNECC